MNENKRNAGTHDRLAVKRLGARLLIGSTCIVFVIRDLVATW